MNRRLRLAIALALCGALAPMGASAQPGCDELLVDGAGVLGARAGDVEDVARSLVELGADVRVRTLRTSAVGSIDRYQADAERACASWQAPDGVRRDNLLVVMVSIEERRTGIWYGSRWQPPLDGWWLGIQSTAMNPRFRNGDYAGGLEAGLRDIGRLLDAFLHPPAPGDRPFVAPVVRAPAIPDPIVITTPVRRGRSTPPVALPAGLAALVGLAVAATLGAKAWNRRARRRAAFARATKAREDAAAAFAAFDELSGSAAQGAQAIVLAVGQADAEAVERQRREAKALHDAAAAAYVQAADAFEAQPHPAERQSDAAAAAFAAARDRITLAHEAASALEARVSTLEGLIATLPASFADVRAKASDAGTLADRREEAEFRAEPARERLASAAKLIDRAEEEYEERKISASKATFDEAADLVDAAATWLDGLPRLRDELEATLRELEDRSAASSREIDAAREVFASISADHPRSAWSAVAGNGSEAEKRVETSRTALAACGRHVSMEHQEWDEARETLGSVRAWLDEAHTLTSAIVALRDALDAARRDAPSEVDAARADVQEAAAYIARYDEDIREELEAELEAARSTAERAGAELAKTKPDYLAVLRIAREANEAADRIMAEARSEHEAMDRLRARVAAARRDAESSISKTKWFMRSHRRDVGRRARALLAEAERNLADSASDGDLESAAAAAARALRYADDAYDHARADFERAEARRDREDRAARAHSFGGSSSFGSWGSMGGGGSGSGGGGSSSFGSSGSGGGGSSGW